MHPPNQPSFLTRQMLATERADVEQALSKALDAVLEWTGCAGELYGAELEHALLDIRYFAINLQVIRELETIPE